MSRLPVEKRLKGCAPLDVCRHSCILRQASVFRFLLCLRGRPADRRSRRGRHAMQHPLQCCTPQPLAWHDRSHRHPQTTPPFTTMYLH